MQKREILQQIMQDVFQLKMERLKHAETYLVGELTTAHKILK